MLLGKQNKQMKPKTAIAKLTLNMNKRLQSSFEGEVSGQRKVDSGLP